MIVFGFGDGQDTAQTSGSLTAADIDTILVDATETVSGSLS